MLWSASCMHFTIHRVCTWVCECCECTRPVGSSEFGQQHIWFCPAAPSALMGVGWWSSHASYLWRPYTRFTLTHTPRHEHKYVKCGNLLDLWHSRLHYTLLLAFLPSFSCSWINTHTSGIAIRARYLLFPTAVCELAFDHHHAFCAWQINFHSTSSAISWNNNKWKYAEKPQTNNSCRWAMKILDVKDSVAAECIPCAVRIGHHLQQAGGHLIRKTAMVAQKLLRCIWVCVV